MLGCDTSYFQAVKAVHGNFVQKAFHGALNFLCSG